MQRLRLVSLALSALMLACGALPTAASAQNGGALYTMSNSPAGNAVLVYDRAADGTLHLAATVPTGGRGTGGGLGNQGGLIVSKDNHWLVVVNAGSDDLSVFAIGTQGLRLTDRDRSDGDRPISVTMQGDIIYVLNAGSDSVSGFVLTRHGRLQKLFGSRRALSAKSTDPAQLEFSPDGRTLLVTEKATNRLTAFPVFYGSVLGHRDSIAATGNTPFGFAFSRRSQVLVSQAEGGQAGLSTLASYRIDRTSDVTAVGAPVPTTQTAACWVAVTLDHRFAYTTNTGSDTISGFNVSAAGQLTPLSGNSVVGSVAAGGMPIDMGITDDNRYLYVLNSGTRSIDGFLIGAGGGLTSLGSVSGLPQGVNGLAVR
jgi:6-phosphogluconolactonase (cycloisomerase 2 family)